MATAKSKVSATVQNKTKINTGVNEMSESLMQRSFEPLFSARDGKARLTFVGVNHSIIEWVKDGKKQSKPKVKLVFSVLDITHEAPVNIALEFNYRISPKNLLGKVLILMGYEFSEEKVVVDSDDEFGVKVKPIAAKELFDFLRDRAGLVYKGNLTPKMIKNKATGEKYESAMWDVVAESIEPIFLKTGEQLRDVPETDIDDNSFVNPKIDMVSEAE